MSTREVTLPVLAFIMGAFAGVAGSWETIFYGAISGIVAAIIGYAKSATEESFSAKKFVQTIIIGGFVGGVAGYYNISYQQAYDWLVSIGAIATIEWIKKAIWRLIKKYVLKIGLSTT